MTINVNANDWNALSEENRGKIQAIIGQNFKGETVAGGDGAVKMSSNPSCEATCNAVQAAALQACNALPFPANLICVTAANAAGDLCRSRC